jgi:predicted nucleotidyltransferase
MESLKHQFFSHPMAKFGIRGLSRETGLDTKTVMKYLNQFMKRKLIIKRSETGKYPYYEANRNAFIYKHEKSEIIIKKIFESGLIDYLQDKLSPNVIVLFGSVQKGTYHNSSDIDIFIQAPYKRINLSKFNKEMGHPIQLFFEKNLKNMSKGLLMNIYNGLTLTGKIEVLQ